MRYVFVIGFSPKSGTTYLGRCLGMSHEVGADVHDHLMMGAMLNGLKQFTFASTDFMESKNAKENFKDAFKAFVEQSTLHQKLGVKIIKFTNLYNVEALYQIFDPNSFDIIFVRRDLAATFQSYWTYFSNVNGRSPTPSKWFLDVLQTASHASRFSSRPNFHIVDYERVLDLQGIQSLGRHVNLTIDSLDQELLEKTRQEYSRHSYREMFALQDDVIDEVREFKFTLLQFPVFQKPSIV